MTTWNDVATEAPELAERVQQRFAATGLGFLATLRSDGSPRISGIEPLIAGGELWLGMMPESRKAADLRRDPRLALHAASADKEVREGDAKVAGRAVPVTDAATKRTFLDAFRAATGHDLGDELPMALFSVEVTEVVHTWPDQAREVLVVESWHPGRGVDRAELT